MAAVNLEKATLKLYEDTSLRDELSDGAARVLLKWAEQQLPRLAAQAGDEVSFTAAFEALGKLMKGINRLTWKRQEMDREKLMDYLLRRIVEPAQQLGVAISADMLAVYAEKQGALDEEANVYALIELARAPDDASGDDGVTPGHPPPAEGI